MAKIPEGKKISGKKKSLRILITQPRPEGARSPYFELAAKFQLDLEFCPFVKLEGIPSKEFRKQRIDFTQFSAVIFTSKNAVDHFFRICDEMKMVVSPETKYFCITEGVALYLQKFILYRKRKVFYGSDGSNNGLFDVINKHKGNESFLYPCSEMIDNDIAGWLKTHQCTYATPVLYRVVSNDVRETLASGYDIICLFTPGGVKSLLDSSPGFKKNGTLLAAFGHNTIKAAEEAGLKPDIQAPVPQSPSMVTALEQFLKKAVKK